MGFEAPLWRAITVFRAASLVYAVVLVAQHHDLLARPWVAWSVISTMAVWTAVSGYAYTSPKRNTRVLLSADLAIAFGCLFATVFAVFPGYLRMAPPLTTTWFAGAALAAAVVGGRRWALSVALGHGIVDITIRVLLGLTITAAVPRGVVLLILAGYAVGYMAGYAAEAEQRFARAVEMEARTRERERLARSIHDSVLQVLAMVQRRGAEAGGEAAELGRLAGEQEAKLRGLIGAQESADIRSAVEPPAAPVSDGPRSGPGETVDLRSLLGAHATARITVAAPATPVPLEPYTAEEIDAAVRAALANVERHCPENTRVWLLVEDEGDTVTVAVRDDGPGMEPGRLDEAAAEGRFGLAQSIQGRIRDLKGETTVTTAPGEGTEIEMRVPR